MKDELHWTERQFIVSHLAQQLVSGRLALVLGAGLSQPFGLPNWDQFVEELGVASGCNQDEFSASDSAEVRAEHIFVKRFSSDYPKFILKVQEVLYKSAKCDFRTLSSNRVLAAIGALVMASRRGTVTSVATLNFDNVLEMYLRYFGFVVTVVDRTEHWNSVADIRIFHPNGFVPHPFSRDEINLERLILTKESFSKEIGQSDKVWYQVMLTLLRTNSVIFIGLSGADDQFDALVTRARDLHPAIKAGIRYSGIVLSKNFSPARESAWRARRICPMVVENYDDDLPNFLLEICQEAARRTP